jgi:two-component system chemotaxis response regulator CheB
MFNDGRIRMSDAPRSSLHRPAVDLLFQSAARWYGPRVIGVVLSGALDDGTAGMQAIKARGGVTVVQDPGDALVESMPLSAMESVEIDHRLPAADIADLLARLVHEEVAPQPPEGPVEQEAARRPSQLSCPECGGVLWYTEQDGTVDYRCRVGHQYALGALAIAQDGEIERALDAARRLLEERAIIAGRLADRALGEGHAELVERYQRRAREASEQAAVLDRVGRQVVLSTAAEGAEDGAILQAREREPEGAAAQPLEGGSDDDGRFGGRPPAA